MPQAHYGPVVVPDDGPDERYLYLSDVLPTAWAGSFPPSRTPVLGASATVARGGCSRSALPP